LTKDDIVIIPAFGTTIEMEKRLNAIGIQVQQYNTTCPFVEKVWNRSAQISKKGYSIIIHGKPKHEETRATFSHASANSPTLIVNDMEDTIELGKIISGELPVSNFYSYFNGKYSENFNPAIDLEKIGVVNQTTQLATDTQAISDYLKTVMVTKFGESELPVHFADTRDTLCYATNDNQTAVNSLLEIPADIAIVMGGKNSSNSSHLVELCENKLTTYFIDGPEKLIDANTLLNTNWRNKEQTIINNYLPTQKPTTILMTSGASCPDTVVEAVIRQIADYYQVSDALNALEAKWIN
jgi:4-hydroxy-3-methylbut-2-enyl diphosphate reductase